VKFEAGSRIGRTVEAERSEHPSAAFPLDRRGSRRRQWDRVGQQKPLSHTWREGEGIAEAWIHAERIAGLQLEPNRNRREKGSNCIPCRIPQRPG